LIESLKNADKQKKMAKKHSLKDIKNMKKTYNTASAFTIIMSNMLDKSVGYEDFEEMNQDILHQVNLTTEENPTVGNKEKSSDSNSSEDEDPPPKKNENQVFYLCTKLMKKTVTMALKILYKWTIVMRMTMMMKKKKMTKLVN
jgi:hypothetical protein